MKKLLLLAALYCWAAPSFAQPIEATLTGISPSFGSIAGGTRVVVTGTGFFWGGCRAEPCPFPVLLIGGRGVIITELTETTIVGTTFTGMNPQFWPAPGTVDVELFLVLGDANIHLVLRNAFTYVDRQAAAIPTLSQWAQLTLVVLLGIAALVKMR